MSRTGQRRTELLGRLEQAAGQAHDHLWDVAAEMETRRHAIGPGDLLTLPRDLDPGNVEWAVLETDDQGLRLVPVDASPLVGSADVVAPECRVLRCGLATRLAPTILAGASRTGMLHADTVAAARQRCRAIEDGEVGGSLHALEVDRDPEYLRLLRGMATARTVLEKFHQPRERTPETVSPALMATATERRRWPGPAAIAASLLLAVSLTVIAIQWRTIRELRSPTTSPIVDLPVVWLEPVGERGPLDQVVIVPEETPFRLLVIRPQVAGPTPEVYRLDIFTTGKPGAALWSGELPPGELPELFVLVPSHLLDVGNYRLELSARRADEEIPAGRFRLLVAAGTPAGD